ncbi:MAG: hypothetical protein OEY28_11260, partial [Nitrospira sp.]|nr:hypothetical protein [Nitrospira sp.]
MSTNPLNLARLVSVILICATLLAACSSGPSGDSGPKPEPLPGTYEQRAWLDKFISHELACRFYFPNFHRNPQAGQEATFDNSLNRDTYRVVWADDLHCIIETKSDARDDICYAYEVAWRGSLAGWVRRAWVGIEGAKAHRANIKEPRLHPSLAQLFSGIKFDFGDGTVEHSSFAGFNYCGRMWSGTLLEASAPGQGTKRTVRISHEAWFSRILMQEWRDGGNSTRTTGMVSCSDNGAALLDWNGVDLPARNEDRQYLDENTRRRHAAVTVYLNSSYEHMQSVRPS